MLDRLLGRAALEERIEELEEDAERLRDRLAAEDERRREAVAARNEAEEAVNRLEDRIEELEDRVERAEAGGDASLDYRVVEDLAAGRLDDVLHRIECVETGPEGALSAMVTDEHAVPSAVADALGDRASLVERAAPCLVYADDAGLVACALEPPLEPAAFCAWDDGFRLERSWFRPEGRYALALVRADLFAVGVFEDGDDGDRARVAYEGFESDVKATHSKGGFSQARFERRRDEQIDAHLADAREALDGLAYDALYVVGEKTLLGEFPEADVTAPAGATGAPRDALEEAVEEFWTVPYRAL